jgi:hypothetical protein
MAYLTFAEYQARGGTLTEAAFNQISPRAAGHITRLTHGRVADETPVRANVSGLMFTLIGYLSDMDAINRSGYKSFSNGSVSASYNTPQEQRSQIAAYAMDYLCDEVVSDENDTPLLYAGVIV